MSLHIYTMLVSFPGHSHLQDLQHANTEWKAWEIWWRVMLARIRICKLHEYSLQCQGTGWHHLSTCCHPDLLGLPPPYFHTANMEGKGGGNGLRMRLTQHCRYGCMHCIYKPRDSWIGSAKGTNALQRGETTPANPDAAVTTPRTVPYIYMYHIGCTDTTMYERYMHKKEG